MWAATKRDVMTKKVDEYVVAREGDMDLAGTGIQYRYPSDVVPQCFVLQTALAAAPDENLASHKVILWDSIVTDCNLQ